MEEEFNVKNIISQYKTHFIIVGTLVLTMAMYYVQELGDYFEASILTEQQEAQVKHDGTVPPIAKVPNWRIWNGDNHVTKYKEVASNHLVELPTYSPSNLKSLELASLTNLSDSDLMAAITYSVYWAGAYNENPQGSHPAVDIRAPEGTPVVAVANGIVIAAIEKTTGFGKYVVIKHPNAPGGPYFSSYSHLSRIDITEGAMVFKGQKIGEVGDTGTATTPHLHFQVDKAIAPWNPYWPFSWSEISTAGLSFFEAVNEGFNIANVYTYTIDPMLWVQDNYTGAATPPIVSTTDPITPTVTVEDDDEDIPNVVIIESDDDPDPIVEAGILSSFSIKTDQSSIQVGGETYLTIEARDQFNQRFTEYRRSPDFKFSTLPLGYISLVDSINFIDGRTQIRIRGNQAGNYSINVADGNIAATTTLEVSDQATASEGVQFVISGETNIEPGDSTLIKVQAVDPNGQVIKNFEPSTSIVVNIVEGDHAQTSKTSLSGSDFYEGTASFYVSSFAEGDMKLKVGSSIVTLTSSYNVISATAFVITHDREFVLGQDEIITINVVDSTGNVIPEYTFNGSINLSVEQGIGELSKTQLSQSDFINGKAQVTFNPFAEDDVVIAAQFNTIYGKSDVLKFSGNTETLVLGDSPFTDVSPNDPNFAAIKYLSDNKIINGYPDGSFRPNQAVNRAEALKMLLLSEGVDIVSWPVPFSDVPRDAWFAEYVQTAYKNKIASGYADGTFRAQNTVNKAEFLKLALETHGFTPEFVNEAPYLDVGINDWYAIYALYAKKANLIDVINNILEADKPMVRAQVAEMMYRLRVLELSGADTYTSNLVI